MKLSSYLRSDLILVGVRTTQMADTLRRLVRHLDEAGVVDEPDELREILVEREESHTTVLGEGVAIPHATLEGVEETRILVATAREPIPFGPPETDPVRLFFLLVSPPGRESEHIKLLARICRLARLPDFVDDVAAASTPEEALGVLHAADQRFA